MYNFSTLTTKRVIHKDLTNLAFKFVSKIILVHIATRVLEINSGPPTSSGVTSKPTVVRRDNYCKAMTLKPTIFWSFWEKGFRYGPRRISYDHAIHRLVHGFKITIDAEICCTFNGESWTLGQQNISVSDFKEILLNLDSNKTSTSPQGLPFQSSDLVPTCSLR